MAYLEFLLATFEGRIGRKQFWDGVFALAGAGILATLVIMTILGWESRRFAQVLLLVQYISLVPFAALAAKRFHDRNRSGWWVLAASGPSVVADITEALGLAGNPRTVGAFDFVVLAALLASLWFLFELCALRGTAGANRYGIDPLAEPVSV
jgi:uncharacterized membrane protein YhaH (DUF805 family)